MFNNVDIRNGSYGVVQYDKDGNEIGFLKKGKEVRLETICQNLENGTVKAILTTGQKYTSSSTFWTSALRTL